MDEEDHEAVAATEPSAPSTKPRATRPHVSSKAKQQRGDDLESSILARLTEEQQQQRGSEEDVASDATVLFCGMKKSGKTSLIDRFINPAKDEKDQPKATVALDYKFARYAAENSPTKITAHLYELGGGDSSDDLIAIPVSPGAVGNLVLAVTLDLSEPAGVLAALQKWLELLRNQLQKCYSSMAKEVGGEKRVEALKSARKADYENHADKGQLNVFPVNLMIFCCKFDTFVSETDPEKRKHLCRALRYTAHTNGASLVFTSLKEKGSMNAVRGLLRQTLFGVAAKPKDLQDQLEPSKPICVVAGKDSLQGIGAPSGAPSTEQGWHAFIASIFPEAQTMQKGGEKKGDGELVSEELSKYAETGVDGMVEQRLEELQQYRRQVERNQRLASEGVDGVKLGTFNA
mmetsp:Transcript_76125/g.215282  ORF Transcript_76125/g.215282 Transcript_76125/m.215282 type:complete len:403 (-) Transcript_76125:90-1298(-)